MLGAIKNFSIGPPDGYSTSAAIAVPTDPTDATVQLPPTVTVSGVVLSADGQPFSGGVQLEGQSTSGSQINAGASFAADGSYSITVPPGQYDFNTDENVTSWDGQPVEGEIDLAAALSLTLNSDTTENVTFPSLATLNVTVLDSTGNPVSDAVLQPQGSSLSSTTAEGTQVEFSDGGRGTDNVFCRTDATGSCALPAMLGATGNFGSALRDGYSDARPCQSRCPPIRPIPPCNSPDSHRQRCGSERGRPAPSVEGRSLRGKVDLRLPDQRWRFLRGRWLVLDHGSARSVRLQHR